MDLFTELWRQFIALTDIVPIDLILLMAIAVMFGRFIWVMMRRTRVWDNLSRSLIAVFGATSLIYVYTVVNILTDPYPGQYLALWLLRILVLVAISWCQWELTKELRKVPSILFIRDRSWVKRRIGNIEIIRALLKDNPSTPVDLIPAIDAELDEMYRFKEVVWEEDRKHGVKVEPDWTHNPYYVERHAIAAADAPQTRGETSP